MQSLKLSSLLLLLVSVLLMTSCEKDDPVPPNEEEVITTLRYTLTPTTGGSGDIVFSFTDLDGDGGEDPVYRLGLLAANTTYIGALELLNEQEFPGEDITEEIAQEDEEHQFFFSTTVSGLTIAYADMDADGNPIGLATTITTGDAGTGTMTVILRHEPNKTADGVAGGSVTNAGGETDIEVTFNVSVL